nr:MAG TPA: hypothetical protein [Caudoviricetes sp.]
MNLMVWMRLKSIGSVTLLRVVSATSDNATNRCFLLRFVAPC